MHYEVAGAGAGVVLLHPGFADSRVWEPQWEPYARRFRTVRCDLPGFGRSPIERLPVTYAADVAALLDRLRIGRAALVGCSLGARIALELAVARPERVCALVLVSAALPAALAASPEIAAYAATLTAALSRGEIEAALEASVHMWLDGPRRAAGQLDPVLREQFATMQLAAFRQTRDHAADFSEEPLVSELADRLNEIAMPTPVLVGELDLRVAREQARVIADAIDQARLEIVGRTAHVPNLERPAAFDAAVLPFLESLPSVSS